MTSGAEDQLSTMTHAHMTDVRVWLPGAKVNSDHLRIWLKRYGTSQVYNQQGNPWTFTHGARTMLFDYSTADHSNISPQTSMDKYKANTKVEIDEEKSDYVALSPIGPWSLSLSRRYNPGLDTTQVDAIYLQLSYSFLPCAQPECPIRSVHITNISKIEPGKQTSNTDLNDDKSLTHPGTIIAIILGTLIVMAIFGLLVLYCKKRRRYTQIGDLGGTNYNTI